MLAKRLQQFTDRIMNMTYYIPLGKYSPPRLRKTRTSPGPYKLLGRLLDLVKRFISFAVSSTKSRIAAKTGSKAAA